jgi:hypothetical protein
MQGGLERWARGTGEMTRSTSCSCCRPMLYSRVKAPERICGKYVAITRLTSSTSKVRSELGGIVSLYPFFPYLVRHSTPLRLVRESYGLKSDGRQSKYSSTGCTGRKLGMHCLASQRKALLHLGWRGCETRQDRLQYTSVPVVNRGGGLRLPMPSAETATGYLPFY